MKAPLGCEALKPLLMGYLDRELAEHQVETIETHLQSCPDCTSELESFRKLKEVTHDMRVVSPDDRYWDEYWSHIYNRLERKIGWILLSIGTIMLASYALYHLVAEVFFDHDLPIVVSLGIVALVIGLCTLLVSVLRERIFLSKSDKYERIRR